MPKITYIKHRFKNSTVALIESCNKIITNYQAQGFDLTVRQLYYRLVAGDLIPNTNQSYKRIVNILSKARMAGLVDWEAIIDRTRALRRNSHWNTPTDIMKDARRAFQIDKWETQPYRVEAWIEKDALIGVLADVCSRLDIGYFSCRGYTSQSSMWRAARRIKYYTKGGQSVVVIHLADHDPSGIDMTRDLGDRLETFLANVRVERIALNMEQVETYGPPPNPAKITDSRAGAYIAKFGFDSWELDALEPNTITNLIQSTVMRFRDDNLWQEALHKEENMMNTLDKALDYIKSVDRGAGLG